MKEYILKIEDEGYFVNDTKVIPEISDIKKIADEKAIAIMKKISKKPYKVGALSKELKIDKKAMALYVSGLEKAGLIEVEEKKNDKVLKSIYNSFSYEINQNRVKFDPRLQKKDNQYALNFFSKFISNGKFDGYICVGAPDPHGEYKSVAKDAHFATYLGMFFGQFIDLPSSLPILLDTDVISRNLFKKNLIIIGGPVTNLVTRDINNFLPIKFIKEEGWGLKDKNGIHIRDYEGTIEKIKNPFEKERDIILIAGVKNIGTLSAMLAATKFSNLTFKGYNNEAPWSMMVRGYDIDGDGQIDSIETVK
ncbi:MAG: regulatory protein ArsR [Candidatus Parvarchaeum acidophilus ARMAN-5]|jgi:predicted transcriptional regulator|uniref:Regulatory protein ArsR n=1 Tax=Candidatus Parvarchaeum acidophilus ARMAN-5 TaxID=662762 RepID=D6GUG7_PARA5|nr:MAG: regulatory protein ArsR [Candidatus Parvarchaeum acidophilus ARMAN-5]